MDEDNPFVIDDVPTGEDDADVSQYPMKGNDGEDDGENGNEEEDEVLGDASIEGLVPLCVRHAKSGPQQANPSVYGYDISQMEERPWSKPGANLSDYFNYGFNETSWRGYCAMQCDGRLSLKEKAETFIQRILEERGGGLEQQQQPQSQQQQPSAATQALIASLLQQNASDGLLSSATNGRVDNQAQNPHFKTRICLMYVDGRCNRGDQCHYAHGQHELRSAPQQAPQSQQQQPQQPQQHHQHSVLQPHHHQQFPFPIPPMPHHHHAFGGTSGASGGGLVQHHHHHNDSIGFLPPPPGMLPMAPSGGASNNNAPHNSTDAPLMPTPSPSGGGGTGGFRMPPKRERSPGQNVFEN